MGVDLNNVSRKDIARVDEFHVGGAEISKELAEIANIKNARLLDIGCGIGGPCRMLAEEFNCDTVGIDLSKEYVITANLLSKLVGLHHKTKFIYGDAINLPFQDDTFDVVWTQHVQMNISDKMKFCSEIERVLNNKGCFIYYEVFTKENQKVSYPLPWADDEKISFLAESSIMNSYFKEFGLIKGQFIDQTESGIKILEKSLSRMPQRQSSKLGLNVLMGSTTKDKMTNLLNGLRESKIHLESGIYRRRE
ncbi:MAG: methyltransferase domain-containing protein [Bacteroidales bacterium]|nr:methyltransferase domain-containing protein [Bacteroidales bacterium]